MLNLSELSLRRGVKSLVDQASVTVHEGFKVGVVGANGCGKSSLFAAILGDLDIDGGSIKLPEKTRVAHLRQDTPALDTPAIEYVMDGDRELRAAQHEIACAGSDGHALGHAHARLEAAHGYTAEARAARLLAGLGFAHDDIRKPVAEFSGGFRIRLNLAQALMAPSDLLLLDEPTNHLDLETVIWLESWLQRYPGTLLVIAHDREFLDRVCSHITHFDDGGLKLYRGNYSAFESAYAEARAQQAQAHARQQREIAHIQHFVDRFRAKATKARQAQSRIKLLQRMTLIAPAHDRSPFRIAFAKPAKLPNPLLKLDRVSVGYGDTPIIENIRLGIEPGQRIGLLGLNGAGKSTLMRLLAGLHPASIGDVERARDLKIGYFAQHQLEQLDPADSPLDCLKASMPDMAEQAQRDFLAGFGFPGDDAKAACGHFSGGEKARLVLALLVVQAPNLLLLDEPTNHLDLEMRHALTLALQDFAGALVLVSHDRHLISASVDTLLHVDAGRLSEYQGDLDDYRRGALADAPGAERPSAGPDNGQRQDQRRARALEREASRPLRQRLQRIERELDKLHAARDASDAVLAGEDIYRDEKKSELRGHLHDSARVAAEIEELEAEWLDISERLESALDTTSA